MQKLKSEKGITLIALVITIIVLMLISVPIIVNVTGVTELAKYSKFKDDIDNLRENISIAFNSDSLSSVGPVYEGSLEFLDLEQNGKKVKNANDNNIYYAINVDEVNRRLSINMKELNYGDENSKITNESIYFGTSDVYIINDASRTIYYVKGIKYKDNIFYRLPEDLSSTKDRIKPGEIVTDFNKYYTDEEGNTAKVPVGFKVSDKEEEQTVSKGLVISDEKGNEFVWIPVDSLKNENGSEIDIEFDRYIYGSQVNGGIDNIYQSTRIYNNEGDKNFFYESDKEFEALSVLQNGGFYIARYESGSNQSRSDSSTNDAPVVKKGAIVYNFIKRNDAKTLAENFINTDYISSRLCSSQAWDTALQFLKQTGNDSYLTDSSLGNYGGVLKTTGSSTSVNNIFDLGGNVNEWTTELYSDDSMQFTVRGGSVENTSNASPATSRIATGDTKSANTGFRITLFLSVEKTLVTSVKTTEHNTVQGEDRLGNPVVIPGGFKFAGEPNDTVQDGIIIADDEGNEFVWIPVSNINGDNNVSTTEKGSIPVIKEDKTTVEITLGRYTFANSTQNGKETLIQKGSERASDDANFVINSWCKESTNLDRTNGGEGAKSLEDFITSVEKNHGYYLARYEAGEGTEGKPVSKVGPIWNNITQEKASEAAQKMYEGEENYTSDLVNSYAWDTAIVYIQAMGNGNYANANRDTVENSSLKDTGATGDEKCHIFDMAGNVCEWTTEYSTSTSDGTNYPCIVRGGIYSGSARYTAVRTRYSSTDKRQRPRISSTFIFKKVVLNIEEN